MKKEIIELYYKNIKPSLCWKIISKTSIYRYTDYCDDIQIGDETYNTGKVTDSNSFAKGSKDQVDNYEFKTYFDDDDITIEAITAGEFDQAEVSVFIVNPLAPLKSLLLIQKAYIKEVVICGSEVKFEVEGLLSKLATYNITQSYSSFCRASFGDRCCKVEKEKFQIKRKIVKVVSKNCILIDKELGRDLYFSGGQLLDVRTNKNYQVESTVDKKIYIEAKNNNDFKEGYEVIITPSCNKEFSMCKNIYNNAVNFRGEPHLPGVDELLKTAATFK